MSDRTADASACDGRQVLVVGDGLTGLCVAVFLARRGLDPTVVAGPDGRSSDREVVERCVVLWHSAVALLAEVDVTAAVAPASVNVTSWLVSTGDGAVLERLESAHEAHPFLAVDRRRLARALRDRLAAGSVRVTKRPRTLRTCDGHPEVEFEDGVRERFDLVVGADGPDSWVRSAGFDAEGPAPRRTTTWAFRADDVRVDGTVREVWGADAMVALVPAPSGACGRLVTTTDDADEAAAALAGLDRTGLAVTGGLGLPGADALVGSPDRDLRVDPWVTGRLALVGGAARSLPPCSLGPSLAVEDAHVLAEELAARGDQTAALSRYEHRRRGRLDRLDRRGSAGGVGRHPLSAAAFPDLLELRLALLRSSFARRAEGGGDPAGRR